jgi:hypothetical protein
MQSNVQHREDAERTLEAVERARRDTRQTLHAVWYSNLAVGAFFAGAGALSAFEPPDGVALAYWIVGIVLALTLIVRHSVRLERELGVESRAWDATGAIVLAMIAGIVLVNRLTDVEVAGLYVGAAGLLAIASVLRDPIEAAAGVAIAVVASAIIVIDPSEPWVWGNLGLGAVLVGAGVAGARA